VNEGADASQLPAPSRAWWFAAGGVVVLVAAVQLRRAQGLTFFFDEWDMILRDRIGVGAVFRPHNGHLVAVPNLAYRFLFSTLGITSYAPYVVLGVVFHLAVVSLVITWGWRHRSPVVGVSAGLVVGLIGAGWENLLWPYQVALTGSLAFGLGGWLLLEQRRRWADIAAAVVLTLALASSGVGIGMLVGSAALVAARRRWRQLWAPAVAAALYAVWYLVKGESQGSPSNLRVAGGFVLEMGSAAVAGLADRPLLLGALIGGGLIVLAVRRVWTDGIEVSAALLAPIAALAVQWLLTAYSRGELGEPSASRYVYVSGVLVVVAVTGLLPTALPRWAQVALPVGAALCVLGGWQIYREQAQVFRARSELVRTELAALEESRDLVGDDYRPDAARAPQITAGLYLQAVDELGSPAMPLDRVPEASATARTEADRVTLEIAGTRLTDGTVPAGAICTTFVGTADIPSADAVIVSGAAPVEVYGRRFSAPDGAGAPVGTVIPGTVAAVDLPDASPPWQLRLLSASPASWCGTAR
jgi:hypothetical protein